MKWNSYKGGQKWARLETGAIVSDSPPVPAFTSIVREPGIEYRTKGDPSTAWAALQDYGSAMREASRRFNVPVPVIFGMMAIEAKRQGADRSHFNPRSLRLEPGYVSDEKTPNKVSPGLMQTLISTAREANAKSGLYWDCGRSGIERLTREDLFVPERSIMVGTAYMRMQIDRKEPDEFGFDDDDPVLLCSAYNAGSVRETSSNPWHLMTYGADRMDKFIAYHNDMVAVLAGVPVWVSATELPRCEK